MGLMALLILRLQLRWAADRETFEIRSFSSSTEKPRTVHQQTSTPRSLASVEGQASRIFPFTVPSRRYNHLGTLHSTTKQIWGKAVLVRTRTVVVGWVTTCPRRKMTPTALVPVERLGHLLPTRSVYRFFRFRMCCVGFCFRLEESK